MNKENGSGKRRPVPAASPEHVARATSGLASGRALRQTDAMTHAPRPSRLFLPLLTGLAALSLAGCTPPPRSAANAALPANTPYLDLVPESRILEGGDTATRLTGDSEAALAYRAALLRRRAAELRARELDG